MIGRRPFAAFGNLTGDQQMLEYITAEYNTAGDGARLGMLRLHDDAQRGYAYDPAQGLPESKVGAFTTGNRCFHFPSNRRTSVRGGRARRGEDWFVRLNCSVSTELAQTRLGLRHSLPAFEW
jgi:hypothetical protein